MVIRVSAPPAGFSCMTGTSALWSTPSPVTQISQDLSYDTTAPYCNLRLSRENELLKTLSVVQKKPILFTRLHLCTNRMTESCFSLNFTFLPFYFTLHFQGLLFDDEILFINTRAQQFTKYLCFSIFNKCLCVCFHNKSANARPCSRKQVNELAMLKISYLLIQLQIKFTEVPIGVLVDRMQ